MEPECIKNQLCSDKITSDIWRTSCPVERSDIVLITVLLTLQKDILKGCVKFDPQQTERDRNDPIKRGTAKTEKHWAAKSSSVN